MQRSLTGTSGWSTVADGVSTARSFTVSGLTNGTRYYFRVIARNAAGNSAPSNVANAVPRTVPSAPTLAGYPESGRVALLWQAPTSTGGSAITSFTIQRSTSPTGGWVNLTIAAPAASRTSSAGGLTNGTRYYFRIAARNAAGLGPWSPVISAVPSALAGTGHYFANCADVQAAGASPLLSNRNGYRPGLDPDGDGVACE